jgi:Fe2+ transport system protein FeoA
MRNMNFKLSELGIGESARVRELQCDESTFFRLTDLGMTKGREIFCVMQSFGGGISAYSVGDSTIALRREDADNILLERCSHVKERD